MSYIGICEYVIRIIYDKDIRYYVGEKESDGKRLKNDEHLSSFFVDAKRYDDVESLPKTLAYKIFELQRCLKCKKEFTEHPALLARPTRRKSVLNAELGKRSKRIRKPPRSRVALFVRQSSRSWQEVP